MLGRPSARLSVVSSQQLDECSMFHTQVTNFFNVGLASLFVTFSGRRIIPVFWNEGDLNHPLVLCRFRVPALHLSFHLTAIVPYLHLHYSILFGVCQEGILNFILKNKGIPFYRREHSSISPLDSRFKRIPLGPIE